MRSVALIVLLAFVVPALSEQSAQICIDNCRAGVQDCSNSFVDRLLDRAFKTWHKDGSDFDDSTSQKKQRASMGLPTSTVSQWKTQPDTPTKQESKPLYHTFEEFLKCPLRAKHKTPIHSIEFDFVKDLLDEPDESWKLAMLKPGVKVQRKFTNHSTCVLVRAFMDFPDVAPDVVMYNLIDFKVRAEWDHILFNPEKVEEVGQASSIVYFFMPSPVPLVKDRDWVVHERIRAETNLKNRGYLLLQRSAEHARKPVLKKCIRAETLIGAATMHRAVDSKITKFCMVAFTDPCGQLPKWLVNMMASRKLYQNMESLKVASVRLQAMASKDPALRARISETVARLHEK